MKRLSAYFLIWSLAVSPVFAAPAAGGTGTGTAAGGKGGLGEEMEVQIKGQFKGRLLVKNIVAPVTMNLEKLQDFPEDPAQKILLDPLPISRTAEFNASKEIRGHAPFWPWTPAVAEPPFLRIVPPKAPKNTPYMSWMFEVLNPEGRTIYRQRSTHEVPDELLWDGKDSEKKFAVVDRLYAAQLTLMTGDDKVTVVPGDSIILPALAYSSESSETIEVSLGRLFSKDSAEISPEGTLMINKICESMRERNLRNAHVRIAQKDGGLAQRREQSLVTGMRKALRVAESQLEHDHVTDTSRGEIAVLWLKTGGN
jgi:hypothetical protein